MRILLINPNTNRATTAMMLDVAREAAPPGVAVDAETAQFGAAMITNEAALAVAARAVVALAQAAPGPMDGVVVSAFGDPGLDDLRERLACPVIGLAEAAMAEAATGGRRFAVATTTPDLVATISARAEAYGHARVYIGTYVTGGDPAAVNTDPRGTTAALADLCLTARRDGAEAVVVGGGPLALAARALTAMAILPIIEPIPASIRLAVERVMAERASRTF